MDDKDIEKEEIEIKAEDEVEAVVVDESQLIELAKTEGLADNIEAIEEESEEEKQKPLDLSQEEQNALIAGMETILFMSDRPVSLPKLRSTLDSKVPLAAYRRLMAQLREEFNQDHRGIEIAELSLGLQLRTKPHMANVLRKMVKTQPLRLTGTNMEVLAIVAYKQPITKEELDQIRGVDSGYVLRNLMEKRLVRISGRSELPGKPMLYGTTHEFMELFNLKDMKQLPALHEVESMVAASEVGVEEQRQAAMQEFSKMVATSDKILFDDSQIDEELEALRSEIASIPTSTAFIDEQKAQEKMATKLAELAEQGLTLDADGKVVPLGTVAAEEIVATTTVTIETALVEESVPAQPLAEHQPSPELLAEAAAAQNERHSEMIAEAVHESVEDMPVPDDRKPEPEPEASA